METTNLKPRTGAGRCGDSGAVRHVPPWDTRCGGIVTIHFLILLKVDPDIFLVPGAGRGGDPGAVRDVPGGRRWNAHISTSRVFSCVPGNSKFCIRRGMYILYSVKLHVYTL